MFIIIVRIILSIALLVIVWQHVHWSVAFLLTVQFVTNELVAFVAKKHNKILTGLTAIVGKIRTDMKSRWN